MTTSERISGFLAQVQTWAQQQGQKIEASLAALEAEKEEVQRLLDWISSAEESLSLREQEPLAETTEQNQELIEQHLVRLFFFTSFTFNFSYYPASQTRPHPHDCLQVTTAGMIAI